MAEQLPPPTRMVLQVYKGKKVGADKGFKLLKNKADALKTKFRDICKRIHETKMGMSEQSSVACFSLTQVSFAYNTKDISCSFFKWRNLFTNLFLLHLSISTIYFISSIG